MRLPSHPSALPAAWQRWLALGCMVTILALGIFGSDAGLHAALHHEQATTHAEGCAVTLFATGTDLPIDCVFVLQPVTLVTVGQVAELDSGYVEPPYRLLPGQAPPQV